MITYLHLSLLHVFRDLAISDGHQNIASCINLPSIQEEGTEINYHNINNDALCSANVEQQDESSNSGNVVFFTVENMINNLFLK